MAYWTVSLNGGPKRANQAAAALGCRIYSFGEFDYADESSRSPVFGIHVLNTESYRWHQLLATSRNCLYLPLERYAEVHRNQAARNADNNDNDNDSDGDIANDNDSGNDGARDNANDNNNGGDRDNGNDSDSGNDNNNGSDSDNDNDIDIDNDNDNDDTHENLVAYNETPHYRINHTVVMYNRKFYMWGGCTEGLICCTKMFCFDPEEEIWSVIPCIGQVPIGRTRHTAVVFNDMMIVYGGRENNLTNFPETVFAYNFTQNRWYEMIIEGEMPANGREFHTACVINRKMYVFGGKNDFVNDLGLDVLNLETGRWEKPEETGDIPCGRRNHSAWVHQGMLYIFGGYQHDHYQHLNTLHEFNPETSRWRLLQQYGLNRPISRQRHCSVIVNDRVFIFGGLGAVAEFNLPPSIAADAQLVREIADLHVLDYDFKLEDLCIISLLRNGVSSDLLIYFHFG